MSVDQPIAIALRVAAALDGLGVEYHLGGSLASSIHGEPRATNDIDLVVDLHRDAVAPLADALGDDFAVEVGEAGETLFVKSAEDIVLRKLLWFREGRGRIRTAVAGCRPGSPLESRLARRIGLLGVGARARAHRSLHEGTGGLTG